MHISFIAPLKNNSNNETKSYSEKIKKIIDEGSKFQWFSRVKLPVNRSSTDFSVWNFMKQCIGKDLTRISMPVALNEPISFLQRVAEYLEYSELIHKAVKQSDPVRRMEYVCAFAVSTTSSNFNRLGKPFNPLLGETYEIHRDGFVFVAEQVCHHPPITAFHAESPEFRLWATVQFRLRFWGKSIEVQPKGVVTLELSLRQQQQKERYTWENVNLIVHNVILGKLWIEHVGSLQVIGHSTGLQADLEFKPSSWLFSPAPANRVTGRLTATAGQQQASNNKLLECTATLLKNTALALDLTTPETSSTRKGSSTSCLRVLFGNWTRGLFSVDPQTWDERSRNSEASIANHPTRPDGTSSPTTSNASDGIDLHNSPDNPELGFERPLANQCCLWLARSRPSEAVSQYNFTLFTVNLNELTSELINAKVSGASSSYLPPTDCRFRPDIRALENGNLNLASSEKTRLEEKQRYVRRLSSMQHQQTAKNSTRRSGRNPTAIARDSAEDSSSSVGQPSPSPSSPTAAVRTGPLWFRQPRPEDDWLFTGLYWQRDWSKCPDLY